MSAQLISDIWPGQDGDVKKYFEMSVAERESSGWGKSESLQKRTVRYLFNVNLNYGATCVQRNSLVTSSRKIIFRRNDFYFTAKRRTLKNSEF